MIFQMTFQMTHLNFLPSLMPVKKIRHCCFDYAKADFLVFQRKYGEAEEILKKNRLVR